MLIQDVMTVMMGLRAIFFVVSYKKQLIKESQGSDHTHLNPHIKLPCKNEI